MDGILELLALLVRLAGFLFQLLDFLHVLHGIVSFIADLMSRAWASIPWFRRKTVPGAAMPTVIPDVVPAKAGTHNLRRRG